jgi:hypothetical protein
VADEGVLNKVLEKMKKSPLKKSPRILSNVCVQQKEKDVGKETHRIALGLGIFVKSIG